MFSLNLFKSRETREMEARLRLRRGKSRIQRFVQQSRRSADKYWELSRQSYQLGDREQFQQLAGHYLQARNSINRWERFLVKLESLEMRRELLGDSHPWVAVSLTALARLYLETGHFAEAEETSRDARLRLTETLSAEHWRTAWAGSIEGASLTQLGEFDNAEPLLLQSHKIIAAGTAARAVHVTSTVQFLADLYQAWGQPERASEYLAQLSTTQNESACTDCQ